MSNVYIVSTAYHLLITVTKTLLTHREGKDVVIIMHNHISKDVLSKAAPLFNDVILNYNRFNILLNILQQKILPQKFRFVPQIIKTQRFLNELYLKKHNIYIFDDNSFWGCWLNVSKIKYNLIEDGLNYFKMNPHTKTNRMKLYDCLYKILGISWDIMGKSEFVKSIEVNENKDLYVKHTEIIECNRKAMFEKLSIVDKDIIASIFGYKPLKHFPKNNCSLLLTQPLSEDGIVTHEKKIELYKHLIDKYAIGQLYIKPHPRENENYSSIFPDAIIFGASKIPFEVYLLKEDIHFNKVITAYSTAIDAVYCADEKISKSKEWTFNFN